MTDDTTVDELEEKILDTWRNVQGKSQVQVVADLVGTTTAVVNATLAKQNVRAVWTGITRGDSTGKISLNQRDRSVTPDEARELAAELEDAANWIETMLEAQAKNP